MQCTYKYCTFHLNTIHSVNEVIVSEGGVKSSALVPVDAQDGDESEEDKSTTPNNRDPKHHIFDSVPPVFVNVNLNSEDLEVITVSTESTR